MISYETERAALRLRGSRPYLRALRREQQRQGDGDLKAFFNGIKRARSALARLNEQDLVELKNPRRIGVIYPNSPSSLPVNLVPGEVVLYIRDRETDSASVMIPYSIRRIKEEAAEGTYDVAQNVGRIPLSNIQPLYFL